MSDTIKLPQLAHEISKLIAGPPPSYRTLYSMVLSARIPAHPSAVNGRWTIKREDLPSIAQIFERENQA